MVRVRMIKFLVVVLYFVLTEAADHDTFKNCSRVEYCNTLRSRSPENKYQASFNSIGSNILTLTLSSSDENSNLLLNLTTLENDTFRIKITEVDSSRYELKDVLDGEPDAKDFDNVEQNDDNVVIEVGDNRIVVTYSPFNIEAYKNDVLEFVFNGDRLVFDSALGNVFAFGFTFPQAIQQYGIHEHADNLALQNTDAGSTDPYRLRNLDVSGYELNSPMSLYGSVPVLYGHGPNATAGIFIHNAAEQWIDIKSNSSYVMVESGTLDLFVFLGSSPVEVVRQYVKLTGTAHLPQLWALGYHQCRWNYVSQDDLKDVVANFNAFDFPLDVIWLDIDYTDGKKYFTWDYNQFSDPVEMQQNISATHKRLITIIDPHIKVEEGYSVYDGALENGLFVNNSDGTVFEGDCWPGLSSYMDFLNPSARSYYSSFYSYEKFPNSTSVLAGIWNDMNEPSVFDNSIEKTLPGDAVHYGGVAHRDIHNIYGLLHTMSTHQGLIDRDDGKYRPFVLTRSHFAGTQRYSAIWTGDNTADWGYLSVSYDECLNANLLGLVFCGADIGGFDGTPPVDLLIRWYQAGAWLPFYRAHANAGTPRREPYLYDDGVQTYIRDTLNLRYQHLPTFYTLFYEHTRKGDPIIRPLWYHYPTDESVFNIREHLLVGQNILVRAVAQSGADSVQVYFPGGPGEQWISVINKDVYDGSGFVDVAVDMQAIPVFYRRGSIILTKNTVRLSTDEMAEDKLTVYINLDARGQASGTIYLDDNTSFNYQNNKEYNYLYFEMDGDEIAVIPIDDDANSDAFQLSIEQTIINRVEEEPRNGKPGRYSSKIVTMDADGRLFRDIKFDVKKPQKIKLAL